MGFEAVSGSTRRIEGGFEGGPLVVPVVQVMRIARAVLAAPVLLAIHSGTGRILWH